MIEMRKKIVILILAALVATFPAVGAADAQEEIPDGPVYIIQEGDTLWDIAQRFGIPWEDLVRANDISDPGQLKAGDEIVIPGFAGISDVLVTNQIALGENLRSISRRYGMSEDTIVQLNHLTSRSDLYSGYNLVLPENDQGEKPVERFSLAGGQSLLEIAVRSGMSPWSLVTKNQLANRWSLIPGDVVFSEIQDGLGGPGGFPKEISGLEISPEPLVQGKTSVVQLWFSEQAEISGSLAEHKLNFYSDQGGSYVALQGLHALTQPGLYPFVVEGILENGVPIGFTQDIYLAPGEYTFKSLQVPPETLDPDVTVPEDKSWTALAGPVTPEQMWHGLFESPVAPSECGYTDTFGHRRSYNGSPYNYFHTGLDFCYNYNNEVNEIYAPAAGVVVFAGPLVVRGNAVMIDHGQGIYTGYMHQEEILVEEGDRVEPGQVIGIVGDTGRVNGPHLHFEVWAGGVQVDPEDWLVNVYP